MKYPVLKKMNAFFVECPKCKVLHLFHVYNNSVRRTSTGCQFSCKQDKNNPDVYICQNIVSLIKSRLFFEDEIEYCNTKFMIEP